MLYKQAQFRSWGPGPSDFSWQQTIISEQIHWLEVRIETPTWLLLAGSLWLSDTSAPIHHLIVTLHCSVQETNRKTIVKLFTVQSITLWLQWRTVGRDNYLVKSVRRARRSRIGTRLGVIMPRLWIISRHTSRRLWQMDKQAAGLQCTWLHCILLPSRQYCNISNSRLYSSRPGN